VCFQTTVTFAEEGNQTKVGVAMSFPSAVARDHVVKTYGPVEGLSQTLACLEVLLAKSSAFTGAGHPFALSQ
jgi:hypothetical protein